jgi:hypothetical protein
LIEKTTSRAVQPVDDINRDAMASDQEKTGAEAGRLNLCHHVIRATATAMEGRHVNDGQVIVRQARTPVLTRPFAMAVVRNHSNENAQMTG